MKFLIVLSFMILVMLIFTIWALTNITQLRPVCIEQETWSYNPSTGQCYLSSNTCLPKNYKALDNATGCNCDNLYILKENLTKYVRDRCLNDNR